MSNFKPEGCLINTVENQMFIKSIKGLNNAMLLNKTLESRAILCDSEHNLIIDLPEANGIISKQECTLNAAESKKDIAIISKVNKPVMFKVKKIEYKNNEKPVVILSRKEVQIECMENYIKKLTPGDIIDARITHIEPFGCFVDIGCGIISLLPIDMISVSRILHPSSRFSIYQDIKVIVKRIDENFRVYLSHKELLGTWEENIKLFSPGQTAAGIVRSVEDYGIFIELTPNLAGLAEIKNDVKEGQYASVYIKSFDQKKMKVKLIIINAFYAKYQPSKINYFITSNHIDHWLYSPQESKKIIETIFTNNT